MPPSSPSSSANPQGDSRSGSSSSSGADYSKKKNSDLPPLFWYMEVGDWVKATSRANRHPREVRTWATLRTKSMSDGSGGTPTVSGTKRLALHHACFKLRSSCSADSSSYEDPFLEACRFVLLLLKMYPEAAGLRESRHGCLPLHLAAFASCAPRMSSNASDDEQPTIGSSLSSQMPSSTPCTPDRSRSSVLPRPAVVSARSASLSSADTNNTAHTGMTAVHAEERWTGSQTMQQMPDKNFRTSSASPRLSMSKSAEAVSPRRSSTSSCASSRSDHYTSSPASTTSKSEYLLSAKREELAVHVLNALLDAYPKGIRVDSEGGRLPLHTACAGRATPKVIETLLTAYPAAARHRNKDGFLPLHLAAHWGVSHPNVAVSLLKAYPDATVGRNRWERTPLEEALYMAGENGRPHQSALVRALRKHPSYWTLPLNDLLREPGKSSNLVDIDEMMPDDSSSEDSPPPVMQDPLGLMGRLTPRSKARKELASPRKPQRKPAQDADLKTLIKNQCWRAVIHRLESHPAEACREVKAATRGGFTAISGLTMLHYSCERRPPHQVVEYLIRAYPEAVTTRLNPSGALPLHLASTWGCSQRVVSLLLASAPAACKVPDELGNVPLHCACFSGAEVNVVDSLLRACPKSIMARNNQGSLPEDVCKRLRHENRRAVMGLLASRKDAVLNHRRSHSSGEDAAGIAMAAMDLNAQDGPPTPKARGRKLHQKPSTESKEITKLGVEVSMDSADKADLQWI